MAALFPNVRLAAFADLNDDEQQTVRDLAGPSAAVPLGRAIRAQGRAEPAMYILHKGWAASAIRLADGGSQILKIHLPGDIMGAPSLPYESGVESLTALTPVEVSEISLAALGELFTAHPRIAALMFLATQQERVFLMERLASIGRTEAPSRLAALLLHLHERLAVQLGIRSRRIDLPLSQQQLGDVLGLSEVHVNRVLHQLEREQLIRRDKRQFEILRFDSLRTLSGMPVRSLRRDHDWLPPAREDAPGAGAAATPDVESARAMADNFSE